MYALTYTYEGHKDKTPYVTTIAISNNLEALIDEMNTSIEWDTIKNPKMSVMMSVTSKSTEEKVRQK